MKETEKTKEAERRLIAENAALDDLSRSKSEFLTAMSHEIKTPLTVISVHVQQANKLFETYEYSGGSNIEKIRHSLTRAQEEIMRTARMTENALRFASMQESNPQMKQLDIAAVLVTTAEAYRVLLEKRGNQLVVNVADSLPLVYSSGDLLMQVIVNLLSNANAHTNDGEITLTALPENEFVKVIVADNGSGIPAELLPHVFERKISGTDGTGVGLAICKEIIISHGGTIKIESSPGEGTRVVFRIPAADEKAGKNV
jgi:signal transduction histidine kinase